MPDIVDKAVAAGSFKTLVAAVQAAGLVDTLKSPGPFTVFAPSDTAFEALPKGTVEGLLKDVPKLTAILTYHVVSGRVSAADVMRMTSGKTAEVKTVQGQPVTLKTQGILSKSVYVNDAKVVKADINATNGVIHVIDKVIMPEM
ncbi:MAG: fasciclin domain-containing protein [Nitrososphaerales archaeon]